MVEFPYPQRGPTATNLSAAEAYTEDTERNLVDIAAADADSTTITVTLTLSNVAAGSFNTGTSGAVTSSFRAATGVWTAFGAIASVNNLLAALTENPQNKRKLQKAVTELGGCVIANEAFIPNYGDRYRHDEMISTAFVESTVNQVISKRFVKNQQMRWTQRVAHLLLQTRVPVLNEDLRGTFGRWFPSMRVAQDAELKAA